jgi:polyisoprenoid-binding protein YceI
MPVGQPREDTQPLLDHCRRSSTLGALLIGASVVACGGGTADAVLPPPQPGAHPAEAVSDALPPPGTYELDPPHTFIVWAAKHEVVGTVRGRFDKTAGTLVVAQDPAASTVDVTIEAPSLSTQNPVRDADLKSPAFFDVAKFPMITYRGRGIHRSEAGWVTDGTLTIREVSQVIPVTFVFRGVAPAQSGKLTRVAFHAHADTKRADFAMTRDLVEEIGANATGFDVALEIDAEALAKAAP